MNGYVGIRPSNWDAPERGGGCIRGEGKTKRMDHENITLKDRVKSSDMRKELRVELLLFVGSNR